MPDALGDSDRIGRESMAEREFHLFHAPLLVREIDPQRRRTLGDDRLRQRGIEPQGKGVAVPE